MTLSFVGVLAAMSFVIVNTALGGPPSRPRETDVEKAKREVPAKEGTADFRTPLPQTALIGGNGVVEPRGEEVAVAAPLPGKIMARRVQEGSQVKTGDAIVELENSAELAALRAADADLAVTEADYLAARRGGRASDVAASSAEAEAAQARAELSKASLDRIERLAKDGAATGDELDRARRTYEADAAAASAAGARTKSVRRPRKEDVLAAQARVEASRARRDQAAAALDKLVVRAPIDGEVLQAKYDVGEYYSPSGGDALVILGDTRVLQVRMDVEERDIGGLALGAKSFVMADAWPGRRFEGKLVEIGRRMGRRNVRTDDPTERTDTKILEVVLELEDPADLVPGLRVMSFVERGP
jgi:multidrug resistance efflux pump